MHLYKIIKNISWMDSVNYCIPAHHKPQQLIVFYNNVKNVDSWMVKISQLNHYHACSNLVLFYNKLSAVLLCLLNYFTDINLICTVTSITHCSAPHRWGETHVHTEVRWGTLTQITFNESGSWNLEQAQSHKTAVNVW